MPQATLVECPKCGAKVRREKLRRHINAVHSGAPRPVKEPAPEPAAPTVRFPWKVVGILAVAAVIILAGYWVVTRAPTGGGTTNGSKVAVFETTFGTIKVQLDTGRASRTAGHFIGFVDGGDYDGTTFHRVAANFVIQGGAISGASSVAWENTGLKNVRYSIAMARSGDANDVGSKDTATSQFFINLKDNPSLDNYAYPYVVFGRVIEGQDVVDAIGALSTNPPGDGQPTTTVTINRAYMQ